MDSTVKMVRWVSFAILVLMVANGVNGQSSLRPTASIPRPRQNASSFYNNNNNASVVISSSSKLVTPSPIPIDSCLGKKIWINSKVDISCASISCAQVTFDLLSKFMTCNGETQQSVQQIAGKVTEYAEQIASTVTGSLPSSVIGNGSMTFLTEKFVVEAGYMNRDKSDLRELSTVPNFQQSPASLYSGQRDLVKISMLTLNPGITEYISILFKDIISTSYSIDFQEPKSQTVLEMEKIGAYETPDRTGQWVVNSQVVHIGLNPTPTSLTDYTEITFLHKVLSRRKNHICVHATGVYGNVNTKWTTRTCHRFYSDRFKTVCRCSSVGGFAVVSQIEETATADKGFSRSFFSQIASLISGFIILGLICCLINPLIAGCFHLDRVRITFFHDVACICVYASFLLGVMVSENLSYADTAAGCIHFFQTAVMSWLLVAGIHNYHSMNPVYDPEVTSPIFFYSTIGWGIPAAFSGACAGFPYKLTKVSEFSWMKVTGSDIKFFVAGPLAATLGVFLIYALIFYELSSWIGSKLDSLYRKSIDYMKKSLALLIIAIITWYSGIVARNQTTGIGYHYIFLAFFSLQGATIIYLHLLKNAEVNEHRAMKKHVPYAAMSEKTEEDLLSMQSSIRFSQYEIREKSARPKHGKQEEPRSSEETEDAKEHDDTREHLIQIENGEQENNENNSSENDMREEDFGEQGNFREEQESTEKEDFTEEDLREKGDFCDEEPGDGRNFREEQFGEEGEPFREDEGEEFREESSSGQDQEANYGENENLQEGQSHPGLEKVESNEEEGGVANEEEATNDNESRMEGDEDETIEGDEMDDGSNEGGRHDQQDDENGEDLNARMNEGSEEHDQRNFIR